MLTAMMYVPELRPIAIAMTALQVRLAIAKSENESGYSTETVIVTALLAGLALLAVGIIITKIHASADNIKTDPAIPTPVPSAP